MEDYHVTEVLFLFWRVNTNNSPAFPSLYPKTTPTALTAIGVVPFLWRFHRMHHSVPEMDVTTATRFHVGGFIFASLIKLPLIPLIGIPIGVLICFDFVLLPVISFYHANIHLPRTLDNILSLVIVYAQGSSLAFQTGDRFEFLESAVGLWDRLFGSFLHKECCEEIWFGLDGFDEDAKQSVRA